MDFVAIIEQVPGSVVVVNPEPPPFVWINWYFAVRSVVSTEFDVHVEPHHAQVVLVEFRKLSQRVENRQVVYNSLSVAKSVEKE